MGFYKFLNRYTNKKEWRIRNRIMKMVIKLINLIFAASFPFLFTLHGDFVFDDSEAILKNKDVFSESWIDAFYNDFWGTSIKSDISHKSYRPLTITTFRLNYWLCNKQLSAVQFKVTNLICHVFCCLLVWCSFRVILNDLGIRKPRHLINDAAYTAAILFSVHPVHVEAVSGIVGRADILAGVTFFSVFLLYAKCIKTMRWNNLFLIFIILLSGISMLFKENGITVLGLCVVYDITLNFTLSVKHEEKNRTKSANLFMRIAKIICGVSVLLYARWAVMGGKKPEFKAIDNPAAFSENLLVKAATYDYIFFLNSLLFIWPQWLCYDWSMGCIPLIQNIQDIRVIVILAFYMFPALVIRAVVFSNMTTSMKRIIVIAMSLTIIPFLPAANIFYPVGFVIAERVLYIPSAGYCLLFAIGLNKLACRVKSHKLFTSLFYALILIYGLRTWQRSKDWQNEYQLFVSGLSVCPSNAKVRYNVAKVADANNHTLWAVEEYRQAIRLYPDYYQAMNNLANLLKNQKQYQEAEAYLRTAVQIKRDFPAAWMNLGIVLSSLKRYDEALSAYKTALEYRSKYTDCLYNLGNLYLEINRTKDATESWLQAIKLNESHVLAWTNLLALLDNTGQLATAQELIPRALTVLPNSPSVNFAIANIYGKLERFDEAEHHFKKAIHLFGNKVQAIHYANLGVLYHRRKKYDLAEKMYRNALKIDPDFKSAQKNLQSVQPFLKNY